MATNSQLEKIAALVDQLGPLGNKQTGMPIEATEWNSIVSVLQGILEVTRAQEVDANSSLDQRFAPLVHDHLGQVSLAWLDADLQQRLSEAGAGVPTRSLLTDMTQKITSVTAQLAQFTLLTQDVRRQLDGFTVNDVDRTKALKDFDTRLSGLDNLRTSVTGLSTQFDGLKSNVDTVLSLRTSLSDAAGQPINVAQIQQNVAALQNLSENFNGIDGNPVRMRDIQLQLSQVSDAAGVGGPGGLDARLGQISTAMEARLNANIDTKNQALHDELVAASNAAITQVRSDFTAAISKSSTDLAQSFTSSLAAAQDSIKTSTTADIAAAIQAFKTENTALINKQLDQRLASLPDQINSASVKAANDAVTKLGADLNTSITSQMQAQAAANNGKIDKAVGDFGKQMDNFKQDVQDLIKSSVGNASNNLTASLDARMDTQVAAARLTIEGELDGRVKTAIDANNSTLDTRIGTVVDQRLSNLDTRIGQGVTLGLKDLPGEITTEVQNQLAAANVAGQIQDAANKTTQQLRSEIAQSIADQQTKTSTSISDAVTLLRGEIAVASKNATDSAVASATTLVTGLRTDFNQTLNDRFKNVVVRNPATPIIAVTP